MPIAATSPSILLAPTIGLREHRFQPTRAQGFGSIEFDLVLSNRSPVPAHVPFLCLMDLGFNLSASQAWHMEKIASDGRRLVRLLPTTPLSLKNGESVVAGCLTATWRKDPAFSVSFDRQQTTTLAALKDMRLFCLCGAANFPQERGYLVIPAATVSAAIVDIQEGTGAARPEYPTQKELALSA